MSVGDQGNSAHGTQGDGRCNGFMAVIQDADASTTEDFDFCIVAESALPGALGNPAAPPAGNSFGPEVILRTASLTTPPGSGTLAWIFTATLASPADLVPDGITEATTGAGNSTWYYGVGLRPNALWTLDGLSVQLSSFDGLGPPFPNAGDNPADGIVSMQQARDVTNGATVGKSTTARTQEIHMLTEAPVLNPGADIGAAACRSDPTRTSVSRATTRTPAERATPVVSPPTRAFRIPVAQASVTATPSASAQQAPSPRRCSAVAPVRRWHGRLLRCADLSAVLRRSLRQQLLALLQRPVGRHPVIGRAGRLAPGPLGLAASVPRLGCTLGAQGAILSGALIMTNGGSTLF